MNDRSSGRGGGFDGAAAVTRSLLGWGVVAGGFYLAVGITLGLTRTGFDFARHALSQLMLGHLGWAQMANLILSGLMTLAAAAGFRRAMRGSRGATAASLLVGAYGVCLVAAGIFPPDPMAGFPPGSSSGAVSLSGVLHLAFGAVGFLSLVGATFVVAGWAARRGDAGFARYSRISGIVVVLGFAGGAALATSTSGVVGLWIAVVAGWMWLAVASVVLYRTVPHPDAHRRAADGPAAVPLA
jgi:hypothetical protein